MPAQSKAQVAGKRSRAQLEKSSQKELTAKEMQAIDEWCLNLVESKFTGWSNKQVYKVKRKFQNYDEDSLMNTIKKSSLRKAPKVDSLLR